MNTLESKHNVRSAAIHSPTQLLDELGWTPLDYTYDGGGFQIARFSKTGPRGTTEQDIYVSNEEAPEFVRTVNEMWTDFGEEISADNESRSPSTTVRFIPTVHERNSNSPQVEIAVRGRGSLVVDLERDAGRIIQELMRAQFENEMIAEAHAEDRIAEIEETFEAALFHNDPPGEFDSDTPSRVSESESAVN